MPARYLWGLLLLAVGVIYLLQLLRVLPADTLSLWWPLLIVLLGLNGLARHPSRPWGALTLIAVGVVLQLWRLGLLPMNLWPLLLALLLIIIGLRLLVPHRRKPMPPAASMETESTRERLNESVSFSSVHLVNASPQFQGGRISVSFGGYELDLREAQLAPGGAELELNASFGGIEVRVPRDWPVVAVGSPVAGACTNKTQRTTADAGAPVLHVRCSAQFGSVEITN